MGYCVSANGAGYRAVQRSVNERFVPTLTHTEPEAVEGMSVDAIQLANQSDGKLHHVPYLGLLPLSVLKQQQQQQQPHYDNTKSVLVAP